MSAPPPAEPATATPPGALRRVVVADTVCALGAVLGAALLHGELLLHPGQRLTLTQFAGTHGWAFHRMARMLSGAATFEPWTAEVSFPDIAYAAHIAWVPAILGAPLGLLAGPLVGLNVATVVAPALAVPVVSALARAWCRANHWAAAVAGLCFVLSPPAIGAFANGQVCKAQLWAIAVVPLVVTLAARGWRWLLLAPLLAAASVYTEPTYAVLGALAVPLAALASWLGSRRWDTAARCVVAALCILAVDLAAARYYGVEVAVLYVPANPVPLSWFDHYVLQVATPVSLLLGRAYEARLDLVGHVDYLGPLAVVVVGAGAVARRAGWLLTMGIVVTGVVVALGEYAVALDGPVLVGGQALALPDRLLAELGFPLADSGQYYRALGLAWLGVVLAAAATGPRLGGALALLLVADGLRATRQMWPVPSVPFPAAGCFTPLPQVAGTRGVRMRRCLAEVEECTSMVPTVRGGSWRLDLPREHDLFETGERDLATAMDGLPTSDPPAAHFDERPADPLARSYAQPTAAVLYRQLASDGVRRVVVWPGADDDVTEAIATKLGEPTCAADGLRSWDVPLSSGGRAP